MHTQAAQRPAIVTLIEQAVARRDPLLRCGVTNAIRVFNGAADGIDGLVIEQYADVLVAQRHEGKLALNAGEFRLACETAMRRLGGRAVYDKLFVKARGGVGDGPDAQRRLDAAPLLGQPAAAEFPIVENGLHLLVRPFDGYSTGLFLDQRDNRRRVRELAAGRRVLNAFCYTCGFSVAAAAGGAPAVVSVDISRKSLAWGRRNFAANGLPAGPHPFICADVLDVLERDQRRGRSYGLIVLDPPSFARMRRPARVFSLVDELPRLFTLAAGRLDPDGVLLFSTNQRGLSRDEIERAFRAAATGRRWRTIEWPALPPDFAGDADYAKSVIARAV